ncbi:MAG: ferrous iron transport protein B [Muribaculaceae bacterium]|nr:ferrous iron transport protein B [Muribaculaceae bacterium]
MKLSEVKTGDSCVIVKITGHGQFRKRMMEMGFVRGKKITVEQNAPLRDPIKYRIMNYEISLRRSEASLIEVVSEQQADELLKQDVAIISEDATRLVNTFDRERRNINVALIGNPNCGKTSLFNMASGAKEHVGNYSGVTVGAKEGEMDYKGYKFKIVDLPGTYSLSAYSPEEIYVRRYLHDEVPDVIINVVDASNLERNLYLTTELIDMDRSMIIALNLYDELEKRKVKFDHDAMSRMIGVPMVPTVSKTGRGVDRLFDTIIDVYEGKNDVVRHVHIGFSKDIEESIKQLQTLLKKENTLDMQFSARYLSLKLMEGDREVTEMLKSLPHFDEIFALKNKLVAKIEANHQEDITTIIANSKYGFVSGALRETFEEEESESTKLSTSVDTIITSKLFGFPIFIFIMWLMFWATFTIGKYPMDWIDSFVGWIGNLVSTYMPDGPLKDMIVDGIIGGVGGVIVFLPNILILYAFISFMEDSGYMARAAFIMDKIMHKIGLHGKSFIPLVMGFGCNVPAIMATRTIESRTSRLITILIVPFMSCGARLPIYLLLVGIFFPNNASFVLLGMYLLGIIVAVITAKLLRRFHYREDETPFVMELPPYRIPTLKATLRHMWGKGQQYLKKMGGLILVASLIIWALSYFPRPNEQTIEQTRTELISNGISPDSVDVEAVASTENSYLGRIGKAIQPIFEPLGFNWKMTVSLISGTVAKETVVSTLGVLYSGNSEATQADMGKRLQQINPQTGKPDFTPLVAMCFMIFVLIYVPCLATIVAIVKESGSWRYGLFTLAYDTAVAWIISFVVYQVGTLFI